MNEAMGAPEAEHMAMAFIVSMGLPPPRATMKSQLCSAKSSTPRSTMWSMGSELTSS